MASTLYWEKMEDEIKQFVKKFKACQRFKKQKKKYGKLPPKDVELTPWDIVCIDLIGPCTVTDQKGHDRILNAMPFVDPATGWFEIAEIPDKTIVLGSVRSSITHGCHAIQDLEELFLIMGMSLRRISYLSLGTSVSSPLLQQSRILKPIVY